MIKTKKPFTTIRKGFHITPLGETPYLQSFSVEDLETETGVKRTNKKWKNTCREKYIKTSKKIHSIQEHKMYQYWSELSKHQTSVLKLYFENAKMYVSAFFRGQQSNQFSTEIRCLAREYDGEYIILDYNGDTNILHTEMRWELPANMTPDIFSKKVKKIEQYILSQSELKNRKESKDDSVSTC